MVWNPNATVTVAGVEYTGQTLNGLAIHYGRPTIWDQARSSYATISILNTTDTDYAFEINDTVVIEIQDSDGTEITVFTGKTTDISNAIQASGANATVAVQTITAVGPFAQMARAIVGTTNYPKEYDDDRITRILTEAGVTIDVVDTPGVYELQERQSDPQDAYTLATYYAGMCFGYMYETKTGSVGYANESRRTIDVEANGYLDIDEGYINWRGINSRKSISDIVNRIILFYKNGQSKTAEDTASISNYGLIEARINTELEQGDQAQNISDRYVSLRSVPETNFSSFSINLDNPNLTALDLDDLINIEMGTALQISNLPNAISSINYTGFVEGWVLVIDQSQALLTLTTSDSTYSVVPIRWQDVDPTTIWTDIDPAATTSTKTNLVTNPTFEPEDLNTIGYFYAPPTANNVLSVADSAALDITGDIDIRVKVAMDDYTPAAQRVMIAKAATSNISYGFAINTTGTLLFIYTTNGSSTTGSASTVATGLTDGTVKWIRATFAAGTRETKYYLSDDGLNWTQLGATITVGGSVSIFSGTGTLQVGGYTTGGTAMGGKMYAAEIRNGINGNVVFYTDVAGDYKSTDKWSYTAYSGQTVNILRPVLPFVPNTGGAIANSDTGAYSGVGSMKFTATATTNGSGFFIGTGLRIPITAGQTYTYTCYIKNIDHNTNWRNVLQWYSLVSGGTLIAQTTGTSTAISSGSWTRLIVTGTAPVGATAATLFTGNTASQTIGTSLLVDGIQFETGSTASTYFDGYASDIPAKEYPVLAWTGTPQQSTSTAVAYWGSKPTTLWQNVDTVGLP
jgi:hypothetical protein